MALLLAASSPVCAQAVWDHVFPGSAGLRYRHALAYDQARGRSVLFSGAPNPAAETWEWDGAGWHFSEPAISPDGAAGYGVAYDSRRAVTVLFTRSTAGLAETWEWDGATWALRAIGTGPTWADRSTMAFDSARGVCVLFGGHIVFRPRDETWEWNGSVWTQRNPATRPPARSAHGMAYDAARGVTVMFGGLTRQDRLNDTWEWNGANWVQRNPATTPSTRDQISLAYDAARRVMVLFGGRRANVVLDDTWEFDGTDWTRRRPSTTPPPTFEYGFAYDTLRGVTVMHGGSGTLDRERELYEWDGTDWTARDAGPVPRAYTAMTHDDLRQRTVLFGGWAGSRARGDTWLWDGARWTEITPAVAPPARLDHAMAFDRARRVSVLFSGLSSTTQGVADTWDWNGTSWIQLSPATSPPARRRHALAYDRFRQRIVLFGGMIAGALGDTWEFDGTTWTQRNTATAPPARYSHGMAWDPRRGAIVMFGGESCQPPPFNHVCTFHGDTWALDGADWTRLATSPSPSPRAFHAMELDPIRAKIVLQGGRDGRGAIDDAWEWNGTSWRQTNFGRGTGMGPRQGHASAFDTARNRVLLFGGFGTSSNEDGDLWEHTVPCDLFGEGHGGGGLAIGCSATPQLGANFCVTFADPPPTGLGPKLLVVAARACLPQPVSLGPPSLCAPGAIHAIPDLVLITAGDPASFCFPVPAAPVLIGAPLCMQGASARGGGCLQATDALSVVVQP